MSYGTDNPQDNPRNNPPQSPPYIPPPASSQPSGQHNAYGQQSPYGQHEAYGRHDAFGADPYQPVWNQPPYDAAPAGYRGPHQSDGDPGTLDLPYYGVGFVAAVKRAYQKYARFDGRASRGEYWWYVLFYVLTALVLAALGIGLGVATGQADGDGATLGAAGWPFLILLVLFMFGNIVPWLSLNTRRFHDQNLTGWMVLMVLIPYVGGLVLLILGLMPSKPEGAQYDRFRSGAEARPQNRAY